MSDNFTPLAIKTTTPGDVVVKLVDSAGSNQLAIDASGRIVEVSGSAIAVSAASVDSKLPTALTAGGGVKVGLTDALPAGDNNIGNVDVNNTVEVSGSVSASATIVAALPAGDNNIGNVDVVTMPATVADGAAAPALGVMVSGFDGTNAQFLKTDTNGALYINDNATSATYKTSNLLTGDSLAAGSSVRLPLLASGAVTAFATLQSVVVSSAKPLKVIIRKALAGVDTELGTVDDIFVAHAVVFTKAGETFEYKIDGGFTAEIGERFEVLVKNMDNSGTSDVYATINWKE